MLVVRMATGMDPARMSYRRFMVTLSRCRDVRGWLDGRNDLNDLCPAAPPDLRRIGL